ncbi:MAG TPA: LTA synthase family protein, partial [Saprospiraceae bacterium]|nr:LTA synthase family protein [Saprospiraceae bacterium]
PYFNFFNSRLTVAAVNLKNTGQVLKYIFSEIKYYPFILICAGCIWGTSKLMRFIWRTSWRAADHNLKGKLMATFLTSPLLLGGLWGGATPKRPDMKPATFSNDGFINQLTLNPVHTWFDSCFAFDIHIFKQMDAVTLVQRGLGIKKPLAQSPVARDHQYAAPARNMNVVLVLVESLSADRMGLYGNPKNLTPGLDALARESVWFDNFYSNGIHTNAGLYSTLYGMPIMMMQHPMNNGMSEYVNFTGLPVTLRDAGYQTRFYCTHPKTFDNLDVFLAKNGFDHISDLSEYPKEMIANSWGVGDESLLDHALADMDSLASDPQGKPFFSTLLTITTHPPFTLPAFTTFRPRSTDPIEITYEYMDWSLTRFMEACKQRDWYDNTVFVILGDHGVNLPYPYDVPLSYNHVPLIIHAPALYKQPLLRHEMANQTDVFPTVMGLLQKDYVQNTLGIDLMQEKRPFAFFSQDHKLGVINDRFLYVARKSGRETLFDYRIGTGEDVSAQYPALTDSMRNYACAQLLVAQHMIREKKTGKVGEGR